MGQKSLIKSSPKLEDERSQENEDEIVEVFDISEIKTIEPSNTQIQYISNPLKFVDLNEQITEKLNEIKEMTKEKEEVNYIIKDHPFPHQNETKNPNLRGRTE